MTVPWLDDGDVQLYHGGALDVLRSLPAASVQTCVTSPPYWGLRDYGTGSWADGDAGCDHLGKPHSTQAGFNERYFGREPGTVVGSGTTCLVARKHGRRAIGVDLSESYLAIAARRLGQQSLFAQEPVA